MSKTSSIILGIAVVVIVAVGVYFALDKTTDENNGLTPVTSSTDVLVISPRPNDVISSPLRVQGEARGTWFFEASFPIKILDGNGETLAESYVQAKGDWMTENFVQFEGTITFEKPSTEIGTLVLMKDNPSGLEENAGELRIPIRFEEETMTVKAFFSNSKLNPQVDCQTVYPVDRVVPRTVGVASSSIHELLKGPTQTEKNEGYSTSIPTGVRLQSIRVENGTAYADFNDALEFQVGGSCRVAVIRWQIINTLKQFNNVENVVISINGRTEDILQP